MSSSIASWPDRPCRFAIISDLHIALPETVWDHPSRFHLVEVAIPAFEQILQRLELLDLDFLLLPGDLTQHGEPENHAWLVKRLQQLPYPVYVVPGNHDFPPVSSYPKITTLPEFVETYRGFGYDESARPYYWHTLLPGLNLIGLNSNQLSADGRDIIGAIDPEQMQWLDRTLAELSPADLTLVMVHHNVVEHLPEQSTNPLGRRYMLQNAAELRQKLRSAGIQLVFTGHLHIQDIAEADGLYDITTGSLVSYPHPFRLATLRRDRLGHTWLEVESGRVKSVPGWDDLLATSREWMGDRSPPFMVKLLMHGELGLSRDEAERLAPQLRHFWADVADGDRVFDFEHLPPIVRDYCQQFGAIDPTGAIARIDNHIALRLSS